MNHIAQGYAHFGQKIFLRQNKNTSSIVFSANAVYRGAHPKHNPRGKA
jgi:hypothetical protein